MHSTEFYGWFTALLAELRPCSPPPPPDRNLWTGGYLDSLVALQVIFELTELTGRPIEVKGDLLSTFATVDTIYREFLHDTP